MKTWFSQQSGLFKLAFGLLCAMPLLIAIARAGADITLCAIVILFLANSAMHKQWAWTHHPVMRALAALWCFMLLICWATPINPTGSFLAALYWGRFILFFAAMRYWLLEHPNALRIINNIGLAIIAFVALHMLWQHLFIRIPGARLTTPFSHNNVNIGHYLLKMGFPMLGLAAYRLMKENKVKRLWMPICGLLIMTALVPLSGERSITLLMLLGLSMLGAFLFRFQPQTRKLIIGIVPTALLLLVAMWATQDIVHERTAKLIEQLGDFWSTNYGQLYIGAWRLWEQHPLTGIGVQQFPTACQPAVLNTTYCDLHPHNMYIQWLTETGIIGLTLLIIALGFMLRDLIRRTSLQGPACVIAAFAYAEFTMLTFPFIVTQNPFSNWPAMVHWYNLGLTLSLFNIRDDSRS